MTSDKFFDEKGSKAIEEAVREAESLTSGEIVPVVVDSSSDYHWLAYRAAFLGWISASVVAIAFHYKYPFAFDFWGLFLIQMMGVLSGWIFSISPWGFRLLVAPSVIDEEVLETARSSFIQNGLMNTRDRTGVLIFVSVKEHRVLVLGDKGIHEKVGDGFWKMEADLIVDSIRSGRPEEGIVKAIQEVGQKLAMHFPKRSDDTNELADSLRRS